MKTLLVGMQSSGASYATLCLAQDPKTIAVIDLWCEFVAPALVLESSRLDVILKVTITSTIPIERHLISFKPDRLILVTRNVDAIRTSLSRKPWRDAGGSMEAKFKSYEDILLRRMHWFDEVVSYERLVRVPRKIVRKPDEIRQFNCQRSTWCREHFGRGWGFGAYREDGLPKHPQ